jgi:hypothetical protein
MKKVVAEEGLEPPATRIMMPRAGQKKKAASLKGGLGKNTPEVD